MKCCATVSNWIIWWKFITKLITDNSTYLPIVIVLCAHFTPNCWWKLIHECCLKIRMQICEKKVKCFLSLSILHPKYPLQLGNWTKEDFFSSSSTQSIFFSSVQNTLRFWRVITIITFVEIGVVKGSFTSNKIFEMLISKRKTIILDSMVGLLNLL